MQLKEAELPGVGKKYLIERDNGETLAVILHNTGRREIYKTDPKTDVPDLILDLGDQEARSLGAILGGTFFQPQHVDSMYVVMKELAIEWIKLGTGSGLIGKSIRAQEIRRRTGASIIVILRGDQIIPAPSPDEILKTGDTLLVVGKREHVQNLSTLL
ncbi:MAG TPA: cation:proton antiporter regulatory subunit [Nitrospiria bacterium]